MTITNDLNVEVSQRIREEYENGKEYYAFHGKELSQIPESLNEQPSATFLEWHQENIYQS